MPSTHALVHKVHVKRVERVRRRPRDRVQTVPRRALVQLFKEQETKEAQEVTSKLIVSTSLFFLNL